MAALTLNGPDKQGIIYSVDSSNNNRIATFSTVSSSNNPYLQVSKISPNSLRQHLGSASHSSLTGKYTLEVRGQEIELRAVSTGMATYNHKFTLPDAAGEEFTWRSALSGKELVDNAGIKLASYTSHKSKDGGPHMQIFVQTSDYMVEVIVLSGMALSAKQMGFGDSGSKAAKAVKLAATIMNGGITN